MTRAEFQTFLRAPYHREGWLAQLHELLPGTQIFASPSPLVFTDESARQSIASAEQLGLIELSDGRKVAVLEVKVNGKIDLQRNRVGLRNLAARFIDHERADAVLGFFLGDTQDYRLSCVARTSEIGVDGQLATKETQPRRYTFLLGPGQACRTPAQRLEALRHYREGATLQHLVEAFKVEPLFKEFYKDYRQVFEKVEGLIGSSIKDDELRHLFTQRLFNRLMFLAFIERRGWLRMGERTDYLTALWEDYIVARLTGGENRNFYNERLVPLFFEGLNQPDRPSDQIDPRFGLVPYLNGGLFERAEDLTDSEQCPIVPDEALAALLDAETGLFSRYNFTVAESTPLEIDVAVDPEMLGKVFEELVTGRHEQGSYYTPKPIVSFMCRSALVEYLADKCPKETREAIESFVHDHKPGGLRNAERTLAALRTVTVCDPACGSGAYLLGMLHELMDLRICLFAANQKLEASTAHQRKLEIIETNLYGVDKEPFAVNIARLRLWLSLAVDFEGATPPPLPNLDFKIEQGDSLASPAPAEVVADSWQLIPGTVEQFRTKKAAYLCAHGQKKELLRKEIADLKRDLKLWLSVEGPPNAFHWAIEFAEVFLLTTSTATMEGEFSLVNQAQDQGILPDLSTTTRIPQAGGFDIVVANPPYVRMELIKPLKPMLRKRYPHVHSDRADLYIYFYARAQELLRPGGVAAFISSNKWLRAGYGEPLRQHLLDSQEFALVMDFGDLPVFESATAYPCIFLWRKMDRRESSTAWAMVKDLARCYSEGVRTHFLGLRVEVPASQFGEGKPRLATAATADMRGIMEASSTQLGALIKGKVSRGVVTGLNDAFIIDQETRDRLVKESPEADEIIKPLLAGDDVRQYEIHYRGSYLIYTHPGVDIRRYPSVEKHLQKYRSYKNKRGETVGLDHRATVQEWFELQQPQMAYREWFNKPKIIYPEIGLESRFAVDQNGMYLNNKCFFLPLHDWYILAVLNSSPVWSWMQQTLSPLRGGFLEFRAQYLETLPIPSASDSDRQEIGALAQRAQALHTERREIVEEFLRASGLPPEKSTSRNPLEQPWNLSEEEYLIRTKKLNGRSGDITLYHRVRAATSALTEQIAQVEAVIDNRVATLYGLDAEDQKWAAKSSSAPDDKQTFFFKVLGGLKEKAPYFSYAAIQTAVNEAELALKDSSLRVYLSEAVQQGLIHDAGRGWYSKISTPLILDKKPASEVVRILTKKFPLLDFHVWSTTQLNPWMHHLIGKPVIFVSVDPDGLAPVAEVLREAGYAVHENPTGKAKEEFAVREKTVVVRRRVTGASDQAHYATPETLFVDLKLESERLGLMDQSEFQELIGSAVFHSRIEMGALKEYASRRKQSLDDLFWEAINQVLLFEKGADS